LYWLLMNWWVFYDPLDRKDCDRNLFYNIAASSCVSVNSSLLFDNVFVNSTEFFLWSEELVFSEDCVACLVYLLLLIYPAKASFIIKKHFTFRLYWCIATKNFASSYVSHSVTYINFKMIIYLSDSLSWLLFCIVRFWYLLYFCYLEFLYYILGLYTWTVLLLYFFCSIYISF